MPVERFRDPEDARRALWVDPSDPSLAKRIRALWARTARLAPAMIPRGLRKFRRIEDANAERDAWTRARIDALAAQRAPGARS